MALVYQVIARPEAQVPDLAGRVEGAARLADLMRRNALPQATPAAHVLPAGIDGGRPLDTMGIYRQEIQRLVALVLTVRTHGRAAGHADRPGDRADGRGRRGPGARRRLHADPEPGEPADDRDDRAGRGRW